MTGAQRRWGKRCRHECSSFARSSALNTATNCGACGAACATGQGCCGGQCAALTTAANCGACGNACGGSKSSCCSGACVDLTSDTKNCGACASSCAGGCTNGSCGISWTGTFTGNSTTVTQPACDDWNTFRSKLSGSFSAITLKGSRDQTGLSCTNASLVTQITSALETANGAGGNQVFAAVSCNGHTWIVCNCNAGTSTPVVELGIDSCCNCGETYGVRACYGPNGCWGGVAGSPINGCSTCFQPTQTMTVSVQ